MVPVSPVIGNGVRHTWWLWWIETPREDVRREECGTEKQLQQCSTTNSSSSESSSSSTGYSSSRRDHDDVGSDGEEDVEQERERQHEEDHKPTAVLRNEFRRHVPHLQ
jgi:hypothetical protein